MKKILLVLTLFLSCTVTRAQSWLPVGNGVTGVVNTLFVYDSVMYVGGKFSSPGNNIAQWNGKKWDSLGLGINNSVYAIAPYKGILYVGGWFSQAGGHPAGSIATWNGSTFASPGFDFQKGIVNVIYPYDSLLYIGGTFDSVNHTFLRGLMFWDGNKVDSVGYSNWWYNVSIMTTYRKHLFLGFGPSGGDLSIIGSDNRGFYNFGNDFFYPSALLTLNQNAFCLLDTTLYLGGSFLFFMHTGSPQRDTVNNVAMWNGTTWAALGKGINGTVNALVIYNNLLIAAGNFDSAGGLPVNNIAAWNGTSWSALGTGVNGPVYSLAVFDSNLYAGGDFNSPGNGIAVYKNIPAVSNPDSINVFPNPNQGQFTVVCNKQMLATSTIAFELYNILGEKVYSTVLTQGNTVVNLNVLDHGVYLYRVVSANKNLINPGKLIIE